MKKFLLLFSAVVLSVCSTANAQDYINRSYISFGAGGGMMYADNTGNFNRFRFNVKPAVSAAINAQLTRHLDLRATIGTQWLDSGDFTGENRETWVSWGEQGQAFFFRGNAYFGDITPVINFNPNTEGRIGKVVNYYLGVGVGYTYVERLQRTMRPDYTIRERNAENGSVYIPVRIGMSTNLESKWDVSFELSALNALSSDLDGLNINRTTVPIDVFVQFQMMIVRYISRGYK
ncbi:hypothetical protein KIH41_00050 [Litoribacter ruber]|uniref:Outer membrane beta-barrel protein n=1 Tax=Litoribacter ruber TaxID=702568 RepID=A0AAP2CIS2_9BACT|nr:MULTISPECIES: hypothetical protein [Litoribacter]MBS9525496.1 hypothetical protein [Litoribacter alkaliphilus]MBT0809665.1 hypothetical protein [Litoribacter ruber]